MQRLSDFPPEVLDCVLGNEEASYLVIKLWLCGCKTLQEMLSTGLTYLKLSANSLSTSALPRLVFKLYNLRYLAITSRSNLVPASSAWPEVMKSLPDTLTSLSLSSLDCQHCLTPPQPTNDATSTTSEGDNPTLHQGSPGSCGLDFASLFPRLRTLVILPDFGIFVPPSRFTSFPPTLTALSAPMKLKYTLKAAHKSSPVALSSQVPGAPSSLPTSGPPSGPLSQLPIGLLKLEGRLVLKLFDGRDVCPEALARVRADCAAAPPNLQSLSFMDLRRFESEDFWLPKSLLAVDCSRTPHFDWTPAVARSMPHNLQFLALSNPTQANFDNAESNWVADLPRTLTSLRLQLSDSNNLIDFTPIAQHLPPRMTEITLQSDDNRKDGVFGDWNMLPDCTDAETKNFWPSTLTSFKLIRFLFNASDLVKLPRTLRTLEVSISTPTHQAETTKIDPKDLPSGLTALKMGWSGMTALKLSDMAQLEHLQTCTLRFNSTDENRYIHCDQLGALNMASLRHLDLQLWEIVEIGRASWNISQHLTSLITHNWQCDWFKLLPRNLECFETGFVQLNKSPLLAAGNVFQDVPTHLKHLSVTNDWGVTDAITPPQRLNHLTSLITLVMRNTNTSSGMLRMLPDSLEEICLNIVEWHESDLHCFPPRLKSFITDFKTANMSDIVQNLPLTALSSLFYDLNPQLTQLARSRVQHAAMHP